MTCTRTLENINQWQRRKAVTEILMRLSEQPLDLLSVFKDIYTKKDIFLKYEIILNRSEVELRTRTTFDVLVYMNHFS
jgi:hypothetical protein